MAEAVANIMEPSEETDETKQKSAFEMTHAELFDAVASVLGQLGDYHAGDKRSIEFLEEIETQTIALIGHRTEPHVLVRQPHLTMRIWSNLDVALSLEFDMAKELLDDSDPAPVLDYIRHVMEIRDAFRQEMRI